MKNKKINKIFGLLLVICIVIVMMAGVVNAVSLIKGDVVEVISSVGLKVRNSPAGTYNKTQPYTTRGMILDGPQPAVLDGVTYTWWKIRWSDGVEGWSAEGYPGGVDYLKKISITPSTKFSIGNRTKVNANGVNVRSEPPELAVLGSVNSGDVGSVVGGPFYGVPKGSSGFYYFWKIDYDTKTDGWSAENYLDKIVSVCQGTDTSCGIYPNCVNCNNNDGCNGDYYRNYYCSSNSVGCTYSSDNCNDCSCTCGNYGKSSELGYCSDGKDNDCDGKTDSSDSDCQLCTPNSKRCSGNNVETCKSDGSGWTITQDCGKTSYCSSSSCVSCSLNTANCNQNPSDACEINLLTDNNNCGSCGNVCSSGYNCEDGVCETSQNIHELPATSGKVSYFCDTCCPTSAWGVPLGPDCGNDDATKYWFVAMRWPYYDPCTGFSDPNAKSWWHNRKILVTNPSNGKQVVLAVKDWGPCNACIPNCPVSAQNRVIDVSKTALDALGAVTDNILNIEFADPNAPLGLVQGDSGLLGKKICIDPGHGGSSTGATGYGLLEKDIVLDVALRLRNLIDAAGASSVMTRTIDIYVSLTDRTNIANSNNCDIFVSIHANGDDNPSVKGTETFWSNTNPYPTKSRDIADKVNPKVVSYLSTYNREVKEDQTWLGYSLHVLRETNMSAILVELAYITNSEDNAKLKEASYRQEAAKAILHGLQEYYGDTPSTDNLPNVNAFNVSPLSLILGNSFTISYTVSDDVGLEKVELWRVNDDNGKPGNWGDKPIKESSISGKTYSGSFNDAPNSIGAYWYGVHVVDNSGNPEHWNDERNSRTSGLPGVYGPKLVNVVICVPGLKFCSGNLLQTCLADGSGWVTQDCGSNSCDNFGSNYCKNGNVYHSRTCYNRGCSSGACTSSSYTDEQLVQTCSANQICSNGACATIICSNDAQCGTNGFTGGLFCQSGNVFQNYITFTCNNPGTSSSYCSNSTASQLKQDCGISYCENWQPNNCKGNDIYHNRTCYDRGCSEGNCFESSYTEEKLVENCQYGCSKGQCKIPTPIPTCTKLQNMKNDLTASYVLTNDINCYETRAWNNKKGFQPIGNLSNKFTGSFNGQGYKITGLYINRPSENYVGLFGVVDSTNKIEKVGLKNIYITGKNYVGSLIGNLISGIVNEVYSEYVSAYGYGDHVGGLIGNNSKNSKIINTYTTGSVIGKGSVGGLVGWNDGNIENSYSSASVKGNSYVGGLVSYNKGTIKNSFSTGKAFSNEIEKGFVDYNSGNIINSYGYNYNKCVNTNLGSADCTVKTEKSYFYSKDNQPMTSWDFVNIWKEITNNHPILQISCKSKTCFELGKECGSWNDGCGKIIECEICSFGSCKNGKCIQKCTDSDGGRNLYVKGVTKGYDSNWNLVTVEDKCYYGSLLIEYYCLADDRIFSYPKKCSAGCVDGACA